MMMKRGWGFFICSSLAQWNFNSSRLVSNDASNLSATNLHMESIKNLMMHSLSRIFCSSQRSFSYTEPTAPAKVGDFNGDPHLRMSIAGLSSRLWLAFAPMEPKEFGELCSCKLFLY
ncbi:hypothetical protein H5410_050423 [Solanum commersonii]|uniref:Uncharacterized protein n=1 Tax=Solanum commersonii TaxID=4109 RepID=A0A9J5WXK0_SOLCO|nr:hypothetical protein H5410_050423 [Solanum commersonii]